MIWFQQRLADPVQPEFVAWMKHLISVPAHHLNSQEIKMLQRLLHAINSDADAIDSAQTFDIDQVRVVETKGRSTGPAERPQEVWRFQELYRVVEIPGKGLYILSNSYDGESSAFLRNQHEADECFRSIKWTLDYR